MSNLLPVMKSIFHIFEAIKKKILAFWDYITAYGKAVKYGYKANAFSPIAWYSVFLIIPLIAAIIWVKNSTIQYILVGLLIVVIFFPLVMYIVLLAKDPKLLQSERYRLEEQKLNMIAEKGGNIKFAQLDLNQNVKIGGEDD